MQVIKYNNVKLRIKKSLKFSAEKRHEAFDEDLG